MFRKLLVPNLLQPLAEQERQRELVFDQQYLPVHDQAFLCVPASARWTGKKIEKRVQALSELSTSTVP
jgi:hypothetical protein